MTAWITGTSYGRARERPRRREPAAPARGASVGPEGSRRRDGITPGRALRRRTASPEGTRAAGSGQACTAAPERDSLALLPSGPDAVRRLPVRGTRPVNAARAGPRPRRSRPSDGIRSRWSGLRVQGTASSPPSATGRRKGTRSGSARVPGARLATGGDPLRESPDGRALPHVPPAHVRRRDRPGRGRAHAAERDRVTTRCGRRTSSPARGGTGKTSMARILAKALNAEGGPNAEFDPTSRVARAIADGTLARRGRDGRRLAARHRRRPRDPRAGACCSLSEGSLQGLHRRRGAPADRGRPGTRC